MKALLLITSIIISFSSFAAKDTYRVKSNMSDNEMITFTKCVNDYCRAVGDEEGYSKERLSYHPNLRIVGNSIAIVGQGAALLVSGIVTSAVPFAGWVVVGGVLSWINNGDENGPVDGIRTANLARRLNRLKESNREEVEILTTDDVDEYHSVVNRLEDLLYDIRI